LQLSIIESPARVSSVEYAAVANTRNRETKEGIEDMKEGGSRIEEGERVSK